MTKNIPTEKELYEAIKHNWDHHKTEQEKVDFRLKSDLQQEALRIYHEQKCGKKNCKDEHLEWDKKLNYE